MLRYILWRVAIMVPTLVLISMLVFTIIELPPGDYALAVGAYRWPDLDRLPVSGAVTVRDDRVIVGTVRVGP